VHSEQIDAALSMILLRLGFLSGSLPPMMLKLSGKDEKGLGDSI
jgi:hypothetical protein